MVQWNLNTLQRKGSWKCIERPLENFQRRWNRVSFCPKTGKLLCERWDRNCYVQVPNNKIEQLTVMGSFSANGEVVTHLPWWFIRIKGFPGQLQSVPDVPEIRLSLSSRMSSEVLYKYLSNCFIPYLKAKEVNFPVVLFVDGYKSHVTLEVCIDNDIILVAFHPNNTHFLQPADVSVFGPLKQSWKQTVRNWKYENHP